MRKIIDSIISYIKESIGLIKLMFEVMYKDITDMVTKIFKKKKKKHHTGLKQSIKRN